MSLSGAKVQIAKGPQALETALADNTIHIHTILATAHRDQIWYTILYAS